MRRFTERELLRIENMQRYNIPLTKIAQILNRNYMSVWQACHKDKVRLYKHNKIRKGYEEM